MSNSTLNQIKPFIRRFLGVEKPSGNITVTPANWITLLRLFIIPLFWYTFYNESFQLQVMATVLFAIGALTDMLDGHLARIRNEATSFGNFMDPLADKLLVLSALWLILVREDFGYLAWLSAILIVLISLREVGLTVLRSTRLSDDKSTVVTSIWGKVKTTIQVVALTLILLIFNVRDYLQLHAVDVSWFNKHTVTVVATGLIFVCAVFSISSGISYFKRYLPVNGR